MGLFDFASKLFGNKYDKDLKEIEPVIEQIKAAYPAIKSLSNDELRQKTADFKSQINESVAQEKNTITELKVKAEHQDVSLDEKERMYAEIDSLEKTVTSKIESTLNTILPEAFP